MNCLKKLQKVESFQMARREMPLKEARMLSLLYLRWALFLRLTEPLLVFKPGDIVGQDREIAFFHQ